MHREIIIIAAAIMAASACMAGGVKIENPKARASREKDAAIAANTNTAVSFAALYADYKAANSTSKREAVLEKVLAKLAGLETIEAESKAKVKSNAVKGRE